jgi:hypothetical protein
VSSKERCRLVSEEGVTNAMLDARERGGEKKRGGAKLCRFTRRRK